MADQQSEVVILGTDGTEHVFPPGFDPKRAAAIVRGTEASTTGPQQPASATSPAPKTNLDRLAEMMGGRVKPEINDAAKAIDELSAKHAATDETFAANVGGRMPPSLQFPVGAGLALIKPALEVGSVLAGGGPIGRSVNNAVPNATRAARGFENVMTAAKDVPVDVSAPGDVALRIQQLAERGGSMPMAVRKLLNRMTDPNLGEMTYKEARDFASNISRLSADEYGRLTPVVAREVANLRVALNQSIAKAAATVGKGEEYLSAMSEYARAAKLRDTLTEVWDGAKKALPAGLAAGGAGYWVTEKLKKLLGE